LLRVGVLGAAGRMGRTACAAVSADPDLELVAAIDPAAGAGHGGDLEGLVVAADVSALKEAGAEVAVDFTVASAALANATWCAAHGVHLVMGTTGLDEAAVARLRQEFEEGEANCVMAPNFAIGAVLMMRFAELAAPWFDSAEIIELHHDGKLDAPSGTAALTARRVSAAVENARLSGGSGGSHGHVGGHVGGPRGLAHSGDELSLSEAPGTRGSETAPGVRVHSVRLRGLVAHQEVLLGAAGQVLTIRHDSLDRASFMPGVILAVKKVPELRGFTIGLERLLGL